MYQQLLKTGATALAGYAAKRILNGLVKSPEEKIKDAIKIFKNVVSIDLEEIEDDARECFIENYDSYNESFFDWYQGSFENLLEVSKFLLATSENSDFINNFTTDEANEICKSYDSIADAYWEYLMADNNRTVEAFQGIDGVYHIFQEP